MRAWCPPAPAARKASALRREGRPHPFPSLVISQRARSIAMEIEMRQQPTATLVAKCKRAAKAVAKNTEATHSEALEAQAILAGYPSWRELLGAHEARSKALAAGAPDKATEPAAAAPTIPIDPKLRKGFYDTRNEDRSKREIDKWWDTPYAVSAPDGSFDVRCLDGGAWDRPTFYGRAPDMTAAVELAAKKLAKWKAMRSRPVAYMKEDGQFDAVLMPQRPDDDVEVLAGPMPSTDLAKWIENYVLAVGGGPAT